jgi:hypothetical protein
MQRLELTTLKQALEGNSASKMAALFANNATLKIVDSIHPPSHPLELKGRDEIAEFYEEVCARGITHRLQDTVANDGHLAFTEECEYPNGSKVFVSAMLDLDKDGLITREVMVQAWDGDEEKIVPVD